MKRLEYFLISKLPSTTDKISLSVNSIKERIDLTKHKCQITFVALFTHRYQLHRPVKILILWGVVLSREGYYFLKSTEVGTYLLLSGDVYDLVEMYMTSWGVPWLLVAYWKNNSADFRGNTQNIRIFWIKVQTSRGYFRGRTVVSGRTFWGSCTHREVNIYWSKNLYTCILSCLNCGIIMTIIYWLELPVHTVVGREISFSTTLLWTLDYCTRFVVEYIWSSLRSV